ncbi:MAG: type I DNA topoisomerase, partial [Actinomycetaceae bacterium]|nr:type I DNA topoisomerase [Actinomycetaceae bacterium]
MTKLVIVESPAKARTIGAYLGDGFDVEASVGHIRDLPQPSELPADMKKGPFGKFSVDVDNGFEPYYVVDPDKKKKVTELRKLLKGADELLLATDEDREGEAIAWHLYEVLKPKVPVKRMVFHEITREAIARALDNPRELDTKLVDAQESRRILDRLVGYEVSPLLWRKVSPGLSAGRVQSVATRLVVQRERERMAFTPASYWDVTATFAKGTEDFDAKLVALDASRIATGKDFGDDGALVTKSVRDGVRALGQADAEAIAGAVAEADATVSSVETKPYTRRPAAPFTTSTLQQEASRKLRTSARNTMRTAQSLYENGYITYMRTDSTNLSEQAVAAARNQVREMFGAEYLPDKPRLYATKSKGAQEAHEAIRPAGDHFRTPEQVRGELNASQFELYELIWKRTVASQMSDARGQTASIRVDVAVGGAAGVDVAQFAASGTIITFPGFMAAYQESRDAKRYEDGKGDARLPELAQGEAVDALRASADGHETQPPPRYTEASLVKKMEDLGIGRPSTYAATISTISDRGYVDHRGQALVPTWTAFSVVRLLEENLPELVDFDFTADMETELDRIASGQEERVVYLTRFWRGEGERQGLAGQVESLGDIDARAVNSIALGEGLTLRVGRYGPYVQEDGDGESEGRRASVPDSVAPDELTPELARELLEKSSFDGRELGTDPETGRKILAKSGRFGPYVTEVIREGEVGLTPTGRVSKKPPKPRTASLLASMDLETITLDDALRLLSLPRTVGLDGDEPILAHNGRYGPYITRGKDSRSLASEEQIFTVTLDEARELFAQPKQRRGARTKEPLRELGADPVTGVTVLLKDGRFGPYVTDGTTNASLRRDDDPLTITPDRAFELLADRRAKGPAKKPARKKAAAKKTSAG